MNRLTGAYRALWDRQPVPPMLTLIAVLIASILGLLVAVWEHTALLCIPGGVLIASGMLIRFAPGDSGPSETRLGR